MAWSGNGVWDRLDRPSPQPIGQFSATPTSPAPDSGMEWNPSNGRWEYSAGLFGGMNANPWGSQYETTGQTTNERAVAQDKAAHDETTLGQSASMPEQERLAQLRKKASMVNQAITERALGGGGPSLAAQQLQRGLYASQKQAMSAAASARGLNRASAMRAGLEAQGNLAADANANAAMLRAQEQIAAQTAAQQGWLGQQNVETENRRIVSDQSIAEMNAKAAAASRALAQKNYLAEKKRAEDMALLNAGATAAEAGAGAVSSIASSQPEKVQSAPKPAPAPAPVPSDRNAKQDISKSDGGWFDSPPEVDQLPPSPAPVGGPLSAQNGWGDLPPARVAPVAPIDPNAAVGQAQGAQFAEKLSKALASPSPKSGGASGEAPKTQSSSQVKGIEEPAATAKKSGGGVDWGKLVGSGVALAGLIAMSDRRAKTNIQGATDTLRGMETPSGRVQGRNYVPQPVDPSAPLSVADSRRRAATATPDIRLASPERRAQLEQTLKTDDPRMTKPWIPQATSEYDWAHDPLAQMKDPSDTYADPFEVPLHPPSANINPEANLPGVPDYSYTPNLPMEVVSPEANTGTTTGGPLTMNPAAPHMREKNPLQSDMRSKDILNSDLRSKDILSDKKAKVLEEENKTLKSGLRAGANYALKNGLVPLEKQAQVSERGWIPWPMQGREERIARDLEYNQSRLTGAAPDFSALERERQLRGMAKPKMPPLAPGQFGPPAPPGQRQGEAEPAGGKGMYVMNSDMRSKDIYSDRELKEAATADGERKAMAPIKPYTYRYKPDVAGRIGRDTAPRLGTMAQEMQQSPAYKASVLNTPEGLALDKDRLLQANTAVVAGQDKRLQELEAKVARLKGKRRAA